MRLLALLSQWGSCVNLAQSLSDLDAEFLKLEGKVTIAELPVSERCTHTADTKENVAQADLEIIKKVDFCKLGWNCGCDVVECCE
jgi:hypothetical protein